jgi:hypothetical protein
MKCQLMAIFLERLQDHCAQIAHAQSRTIALHAA